MPQTIDLWSLTGSRSQLDAEDLADAILVQLAEEDLDYRTRLLIRDSVEALRNHWQAAQFRDWLADCPDRDKLEGICREKFDKVGFPSLSKRLMDKTRPETIRKLFEHLGRSIGQATNIVVARSGALILTGRLVRNTEDIDVIDAVPKEIRESHQLLEELERVYGLRLGHVQSHYFPAGWQERIHSHGTFGHLHVSLMDVYDVFLSKLFSARIKDMGDLRELLPQLDRDVIVVRLKETCTAFLAEDRLRQVAGDNWQILLGEPLPQ